jgi:BolA protein
MLIRRLLRKVLKVLDMHHLSSLSPETSWQPLMAQTLQAQFSPSFLEVIDESYQHAGHSGASESGLNSHFRVRISSAQFEGLTRVQRHRLVYDSLQEFLDHGLHALAIEFR